MKKLLRTSPTLRTSLTLALFVLICAATVAATETASSEIEAADGARGAATRALSSMPESGALLLWATGLAIASCAVARKRTDPDK